MNETKIGEIRGYSMYYDPGTRRFNLHDSDGNQVADAATQDQLEEKAKRLSKKKHKLPMPVLKRAYQGSQIERGQITSLNIDDGYGSVMATIEGRRGKERLDRADGRYHYLFAVTPHNEAVVSKVNALAEKRDAIGEEIKEATAQLEKPITREYFGLE